MSVNFDKPYVLSLKVKPLEPQLVRVGDLKPGTEFEFEGRTYTRMPHPMQVQDEFGTQHAAAIHSARVCVSHVLTDQVRVPNPDKTTRTTTFSELKVGDVFEWGNLYAVMGISPTTVYCVCLNTDKLYMTFFGRADDQSELTLVGSLQWD